MSTVADPEVEKLRAVFLRLERLIRRASNDLDFARLTLLAAEAAFCSYPPITLPEPPEADR